MAKSFFILDQTVMLFDRKIIKLEKDITKARNLAKKNFKLKRRDIAKSHFYWKLKLEKLLLRVERKRMVILQARM